MNVIMKYTLFITILMATLHGADTEMDVLVRQPNSSIGRESPIFHATIEIDTTNDLRDADQPKTPSPTTSPSNGDHRLEIIRNAASRLVPPPSNNEASRILNLEEETNCIVKLYIAGGLIVMGLTGVGTYEVIKYYIR